MEPGRIFGLLGANGAGKTTCMRIVLDILRLDSGTAAMARLQPPGRRGA